MERQFFAQIDENNIVIDVHVVTQEFIDANPERYPGVWVETFFDTENKTYAGMGFIYDEATHDFIAPSTPEIVEP
jgi:hypothetical protein